MLCLSHNRGEMPVEDVKLIYLALEWDKSRHVAGVQPLCWQEGQAKGSVNRGILMEY